jgi:hypothetical protein
MCKLANGATECFGTLQLAQITADTVQGLGSSWVVGWGRQEWTDPTIVRATNRKPGTARLL